MLTPTPDPSTLNVVLPSGSTLIIQRSMTYGDIAVTVAVVGLITLFVIYFAFKIGKTWFPS